MGGRVVARYKGGTSGALIASKMAALGGGGSVGVGVGVGLI